MELFKKQFILSKTRVDLPTWKEAQIKDYTLQVHPDLPYTSVQNGNTEIHLLGDLYDWVIPFQTNLQILNSLKESDSIFEYIEQLENISGQFVLIFKIGENLFIHTDACAQCEVYYDTTFSTFASQPKLLSRAIELIPHEDQNLNNFFNSTEFLSKKVYFGNITHARNVKHLQPNHHIDITNHKVVRHFPMVPIKPVPLDESAGRATVMILGYLKAIAHRYRMAMAVTAGYDSRVLFLSSIDLPCQYFVYKHSYMNDDHFDITVPQTLTNIYDKKFDIIPDLPKSETTYGDDYEQSIDFPRFPPLPSKGYQEHIYVNGNISEVGRNYFGYHKNINAKDLAYLNGYKKNKFVIAEYEEWIKNNKAIFDTFGYNLLDMFYWEEKMGNWAAKAKTEGNALGLNQVSPFNSMGLLNIMLSSRRELRDSHHNILYNRIIELIDPNSLKIPINPNRKQNIIRLMKKLKVYNIYRFIGVKLQLLKL
jgi:hypothetical protein